MCITCIFCMHRVWYVIRYASNRWNSVYWIKCLFNKTFSQQTSIRQKFATKHTPRKAFSTKYLVTQCYYCSISSNTIRIMFTCYSYIHIYMHNLDIHDLCTYITGLFLMKLHRIDYVHRPKMMRIITNELSDSKSIDNWNEFISLIRHRMFVTTN